MQKFFKRQWFLLVLIAVVTIGYLHPGPGISIYDHVPLSCFIFVMLFLMSSTLETSEIRRAVTNLKGLAICVGTGYIVVGGLCWLAARAFFGGVPDLFVGLVIVGAVPCTLVSAAVWTRLSGGNDALALATTITSNSINFLVAPLVLNLALARFVTGKVVLDPADMMMEIFVVIVLPVGIGQLCRIPAPVRAFADGHKKTVGVIGRCIILTIVLIASSRVGAKVDELGIETIGLGAVALLEASLVTIHVSGLLAAHFIMKATGASDRDRIAAMMSGSQKTLPAAIWLSGTFFAPYPFAVLPAMLYHATQLIIDSGLMEYLKHDGGELAEDAEVAPQSEMAEPEAGAPK